MHSIDGQLTILLRFASSSIAVGPEVSQMGGIFLSYRRDDATGFVHALRDRLASRFGSDQIFMDIDSIEPGLDFVEVIENSVASCSIVLALIGKRFQPERLQDNRDFVRLEIQMALEKKIRVIPVLLEGAEMPSSEVFPEALAPLSRRQAFEISNRHFSDDLDALAELVGRILKEQEAKKESPPPPPPKSPLPEPVTIKTDQPVAKRSDAPLPAVHTRSRSLRLIASRGATVLAWLVAGMYVVYAIVGSDETISYSSTVADKVGVFFLVSGSILLLLGLILRIRQYYAAWIFFLSAGFCPFGALIAIFSGETPPSVSNVEYFLFMTAVFSVFALAFFFLAHHYRKRP